MKLRRDRLDAATGRGTNRGTNRGRRRRGAGLAVAVGASPAIIGTVAGCGSVFGWPLELASHFCVHYAVVSTIAAVTLFVLGCRRLAIPYVVVAALNLALIAPLYLPPGGHEPLAAANAPRLQLLQFNLHARNTELAAVVELIRERSPDVLVLQEVTSDTLALLVSGLGTRYPHRKAVPLAGPYGIALFSRVPLADVEVIELTGLPVPSIVAQVEVNGVSVTLLCTHPPPPMNERSCRARDEQLGAIAACLSRRPRPHVVVGDLNITPWSHAFGALNAEAELRDSARGFGVQATWPSGLGPLGIPIDHCLVSSEVVVLDRRLGPASGSDHRPVFIELEFR